MPKVLIIPKMIPLTRKQPRRTSQAQQPPSGGSWSEYFSLLVSLLFSLMLVLVVLELVSAIRGVCSVSCLVSIMNVECFLSSKPPALNQSFWKLNSIHVSEWIADAGPGNLSLQTGRRAEPKPWREPPGTWMPILNIWGAIGNHCFVSVLADSKLLTWYAWLSVSHKYFAVNIIICEDIMFTYCL